MEIKKCKTCNKELPFDLIGHTVFSYDYYAVQFHSQLHNHELNLSDEDYNFCSERCISEFYMEVVK